MTEELKPCPFCGAKDSLYNYGEVICGNCGAEGPWKEGYTWNRRV